MCGIVGLYHLNNKQPVSSELLSGMVSMLRHRGPDEAGAWIHRTVGLGSARLSIIDLKTGQQPIHNEDKTIWVVFNGEIFNYRELRRQLVAQGHCFYTQSDTEVLVHLYEQEGPAFLNQLNGQFALALWDSRQRRLLLGRDRLGVRPLFYTTANGCFMFASEIKALLLNDKIKPEINLRALDQIFTFWALLPPETIFKGIYQLPPGHYLLADRHGVVTRPYWQLSFPIQGEEVHAPEAEYIEQLRELVIDATRLRLQADVPVGIYLSGGIDSSVVASTVRFFSHHPVNTFSVRFTNDFYDESPYQQIMVDHLQATHRAVNCSSKHIGQVFPDVIWHTETPILRTAPAPLYMLSDLVHQSGIKVVLSGEGGDEVFLGYDLFKETKIRRYWAQHPETRRTVLFRRLYPYLTLAQLQSPDYLKAFFGTGLMAVDEPHYSHLVTWMNTAKAKKFFSEEMKAALAGSEAIEDFKRTLPEDFDRWHFLSKAQYIDMKLLLGGYLLASQGDRMAMAHSVEGRFPFLDHRVIELAASMPPRLKLRGMSEKDILKRAFADCVPASVRQRPKQAYRAPNIESFFADGQPLEYVADVLQPAKLRDAGCFNPALVEKLVQKFLTQGKMMGEVDNMAFVGILSLQLVYAQFINSHSSRFNSAGVAEKVRLRDAEPLIVANNGAGRFGARVDGESAFS
jgi:asparagine synthase (glutamine-hydrolysing)